MIELESKEQFDDLLAGTDDLVVVDFWAEWCGPCQTFGPIFKEVAQNREDDGVTFVKVNIEAVPALPKEYSVRSIPEIKFIGGDDGEILHSHTGVMSETELEEKVDELS